MSFLIRMERSSLSKITVYPIDYVQAEEFSLSLVNTKLVNRLLYFVQSTNGGPGEVVLFSETGQR